MGVGTTSGHICNEKSLNVKSPQDLQADGWKVSLHEQSRKIQKKYQAVDGWTNDKTLQIQSKVRNTESNMSQY